MPDLNWVSYNDFSGGENVDASPDNLADNEVAKAENVDFNIRGGFTTRLGCIKFNAVSYGAQVEQIFEWKKLDGSIQLMAVIGTNMCKIAEDGTSTVIQALDLAAKKCFHFEFQNKLYFGDGHEYYCYDGTTCRTVSSAAPTTAPALAGSGSGSFTGTFKGKVTFINWLGLETDASPAGTSAALSSAGQINWTSIPVGGSDIVQRKLYRTKANGSDFYYVATINDNVTTAYTDTTADAGLYILLNTGDNLAAVKRCKFAIWHDKSYRWLFSGDPQNKTAVYYSEANEPHNIKASSILYPTQGMGEILGLKMFGDAVIVFYRYGARKWSGIDPTKDAQWLEIPVPEGALSNDAITLTPGSMTYLGKGGWWMLPPTILNYNVTMQTDKSMVPNIAFSKQIKTITAITRTDISCSVYDPVTGYLMLAYTKTVGESRNSRVLINLWGTNAFWHYTGWQVNDWCLRANGDLLYAGNGYIYKARTGTNDAGTAINQQVECKPVNLGYPHNYKILGKFLVKSGPRSERSTADIKIKSAASSVAKTNVQLLQNVRKWTDPWDSPWASKDNQLTEINFDPGLTGQEFQVVYSNNRLNETILIYSQSYGYKIKSPIGKRI